MAIDGGLRRTLAAGTKLVATYKKEEHTAVVVAGEDGKLRFRLADGREFASPSAAGSAVMNGIACNGWRFWSVAGEAKASPRAATRAVKPAVERRREGSGVGARAATKPRKAATESSAEADDEPSSERAEAGPA